jgi:hypothetical protein
VTDWKATPGQRFVLHALCSIAILLVTGCQTADRNFSRIINEPAPLPDDLRAAFGKVGVVPDALPLDPRLSRPLNKPDAMVLISERTYRNIDRTLDPEKGSTVFFEMFFAAPFSAAVGLLGGLASGVTEHDLQKAEAAIRKVIREEPLERGLQGNIYALAGEQRRTNLVALHPDQIAALRTSNSSNLNYRVLATTGVDSVLLVRMVDHRFETRDAVNPKIAFAVEANVALVRVADGQELTRSALSYRSPNRTLTNWAAHDAKALRVELETARNLFAEVILDQYFGDRK